MRTAGKWMVGLSIFFLIGTFLFSVGVLAAGAVVGGMFFAMIEPERLPEMSPIHYSVPIGSPLFYIYIGELALLICGIMFIIFGKKKTKTVESL